MAGEKTAARKRAMEAKAKLDAERAARDALELEKITDFYAATDRRDAAAAAVEAAQRDVEAAVMSLVELGKTVSEVAVVTELEPSEVRRIKRAVKARATTATAAAGGDAE